MERKYQQGSGNQIYLKEINRSKILNLLRSHGSLSRTELARISGLNNKTITNIINYFLSQQIVISTGLTKSDEGRRKEHLKINSNRYYSIGIDIGASHISTTLIDLEGNILCEKTYSFRFGLRGSIILEKMMSLTQQLFDESAVDMKRILGIGFTAPGFFDKEKGIWNLAFNIAEWNTVPIKDILFNNFHTDIYLQDCSRSMALAELWYGEGKDHDNFILVDIGQGIGLGIVINGFLYEGSNLKSGEIGHLIVDPDGRRCTCGNYGCLESVASGTAIAAIVQEKIKAGVSSKVVDLVNDHIDEISATDVVEAANMNDSLSIEVLKYAGENLGKAISYIINLFNPGLIVLGGQLSKAGAYLIDPLLSTVKKSTLPNLFNDVSIKMSKLGHLSASLGAATIVINDKIFNL